MKLTDILTEKDIIVKNDIFSKEDIIKNASGLFSKNAKLRNLIFKKMIDREKVASTGIGNGIAIPHAIFREYKGLNAKMMICRNGIDFSSIDGKPVYIFIFIASDLKKQEQYIHLLSNAAKLFFNESMTKKIILEEKPSKILKILESYR